MKKIVLFASGNGSNVDNIIQHFKNSKLIAVAGVFTNNPQAKVLEKSRNHNVATFVFSKNDLESHLVLQKLQSIQPDLIVLAGFLLKFPEHIIAEFPNKIINVHPALLPKYGGKGMYGMHVHKAVLENKEKETGITIHYVNEHYDEGEFIFQESVNVEDCYSAEAIAAKVQSLEHEYFPKVIDQILNPKS